jgi:hypothetical protein
MIDAALIVWFVLTGLSVAYVAWDAFTRNPELTVMKYGWVLVTLYAGPVAAALYVLSCQDRDLISMRRSSGRCGSRWR